jgi:hypothetical protein
MICSCVGNITINEGTSWGDFLLLWVSKHRTREKARGFVWEKNYLFYNTHFISMNNNKLLVLNVMTLMKKYSLHFKSIVYCFRLLAWLEKTSTGM